MVPRLLLSLVSLLLLLVSLWTGTSALETTLTVNLTDDEARNKEFKRATPVCYVKFILPTGFRLNPQCPNQTCERNGNDTLNVVAVKEDSTERFTFNITFDLDRKIGCSNYLLPNINYFQGTDKLRFNCDPVFPCNSNGSTLLSDDDSVRWWRFASTSDLEDFQNSMNKEGYNHGLDDTEFEFENNALVMNRTSEFNVVGYYIATFHFEGGNISNGDTFIIYVNPRLHDGESSGDQELIFGSKETRNYDEIHCTFFSFPSSTVSWDGPKSNFTTQDTGRALEIGVNQSSDLTMDGRLVFSEVQYEDGVEITCTATHSFSGAQASHSLRLRVRNPLRPLWPALGVIGSFIITFLFIAGGALVDKIRGKQGADDDDGSFQRNYSVVSNLGEETGGGRRSWKHPAAGKRVSITQQELLSDANN